MKTPLGWLRARLLLAGTYQGTPVEPGSPRERLLLQTQLRLDKVRAAEVQMQILAPTIEKASTLRDAYKAYLHDLIPSLAEKEKELLRSQHEKMKHLDKMGAHVLGHLERFLERIRGTTGEGAPKPEEEQP